MRAFTRAVMHRVAGLWTDPRGVSAVEFGIMAPLYLFILAGIVDLGGAVYTKMRVDSAITAAATYSMTKGDAITSKAASALAADLVGMIAQNVGTDGTTATITINDGPSLRLVETHATKSGTDANADLCFCPQRTGAAINWGASTTCGTTCPGGGAAGKFVAISVARTYTPLFPMYRFMPDDPFAGFAMVQAK